mgnify:CR=1 FL=1
MNFEELKTIFERRTMVLYIRFSEKLLISFLKMKNTIQLSCTSRYYNEEL